MGGSEEEAWWDNKHTAVKKGGPGPGLWTNQQEALVLKAAAPKAIEPICEVPCPSSDAWSCIGQLFLVDLLMAPVLVPYFPFSLVFFAVWPTF